MGTTIRIEAYKGENTTKEQWEELEKYFSEKWINYETDEYYLSITIHCPYSKAYIEEQIDKDIRDKLEGSNITINLWYEERDPDESLSL